MHMKKKRTGKSKLFVVFTILFTICTISCKDDDMSDKLPIMNHSDDTYTLSSIPTETDSIYEVNEQPYHLWSLSIDGKETKEQIAGVSFSSQTETDITDDKGDKIGEVKYGKNDVLEINIYNFCTLKRKLDSQKGKMYIITPTQNKRNDISVNISIMLDKGGPATITIK